MEVAGRGVCEPSIVTWFGPREGTCRGRKPGALDGPECWLPGVALAAAEPGADGVWK